MPQVPNRTCKLQETKSPKWRGSLLQSTKSKPSNPLIVLVLAYRQQKTRINGFNHLNSQQSRGQKDPGFFCLNRWAKKNDLQLQVVLRTRMSAGFRRYRRR